MQNAGRRAILIGSFLFLGILVARIISDEVFTMLSLVGPAVGGIVCGLVVYFLGNFLSKKKS